MRPLVQTLAQTANYVASAAVPVDLPRDGVIVGIDILLEAQYDNGAAVTPNSDAFHRIIKSLEIAGGTPKYVSLSSILLWHLLNMADRGSSYKSPKVDTTVNTTGLRAIVPYTIHFGTDPDTPFAPLPAGGPLIGIPAQSETKVTATVTFDASGVMGTGITVSPATLVRFAVRTIQGPDKVAFRPVISTDVYSITQTWSNFSLRFNVPTEKWIRRLAILSTDNATPPSRVDNRIARVGLILPSEAQSRRIELTWNELKHYTLLQYPRLGGITDGSAPNVDGSNGQVGFAVIDFRKLSRHPFGLKMLGKREGSVQIGIDIAIGSGTLYLLWDTIEPV